MSEHESNGALCGLQHVSEDLDALASQRASRASSIVASRSTETLACSFTAPTNPASSSLSHGTKGLAGGRDPHQRPAALTAIFRSAGVWSPCTPCRRTGRAGRIPTGELAHLRRSLRSGDGDGIASSAPCVRSLCFGGRYHENEVEVVTERRTVEIAVTTSALLRPGSAEPWGYWFDGDASIGLSLDPPDDHTRVDSVALRCFDHRRHAVGCDVAPIGNSQADA